ncbi:MAG: ferrochelatase [Bacteroidales bacterium]|nr:ferrochelatase [Bacteroidales bacterium]
MTGILLINIGTPDSPKTKDVRKYLGSFLNDPRVIDIPWIARKALVNLIIVPFRSPKSAKLYQEIWTEKGSPLLSNSIAFKEKLQQKLGDQFMVEIGMRYGNPGLEAAFDKFKREKVEKIILLPVFPQYASSTSGSAIEESFRILSKWSQIPQIKTIEQFFNKKAFQTAFADRVKKYKPEQYDHIVMSYHGLPLRQVFAAHPGHNCDELHCKTQWGKDNYFCYQSACYATSRLLAEKLGLPSNAYSTSFQSRLGKGWITPFTDILVKEKASSGTKKILVISPAFVADCLETEHELAIELKNEFIENGGEQLTLVESLNDSDLWVSAVESFIKE